MAKIRVIAHFMHEEEMDAAMTILANPQATGGFVLGELDEDSIDELKAKGLIVERMLPKAERRPRVEVLMKPAMRSAMATARATDELPVPDPTKPAVYVITLNGPLLPDWHEQIEAHSVSLIESIGRDEYTARLDGQGVDTMRGMPFVESVRPYGHLDESPIPTAPMAMPERHDEVRMETFDVRLHRAEDNDRVVDWLRARGAFVSGAKGRKVRIQVPENAGALVDLSALPEVQALEPYIPPKLHNDRARVLVGVDRANPGGARLPETGAGQIVGVADTGIDDKHPDLKSRIAGVVALGRPNDPSDPHGHGTHVSGTIVGDGTASTQGIRGIAPGAQLFFQSIMDAAGNLGGLPFDLNDLFDEAYQNGARIHNNSWGSATASRYTVNSIEVDEFVHSHKDMLIIISAGNEGTASVPRNTATGFVDWLSIGSPASCKNALTVGASRSDRTTGGYATLTNGQAWPNDFPAPPVGSETVSGDPEAMAAFSSRGPCDDRRIKPDLVAPGTDIVSTKSSRAPLRNFWGSFPQHGGRYAYMGGTSMAAPVVAGCAALVREHFIKVRHHEASAALLKATLINSTRWLAATSSTAEFADAPNFHQGFGCIDMTRAYPNPDAPNLRLEWLDTWRDVAHQFTLTGQRFRFQINVGSATELRICLTWTDPPARSLQNNLDLFVQQMSGARTKSVGNVNLPLNLKIPDPDNNVEIIRIGVPDIAPGAYLIQITASNLLVKPQDFALAVTGDLQSGLVEV